MEINLINKVVLITGGSRGIGLHIAKLFIQNGAFVIITGRNESSLCEAINQLGKNAKGFITDHTSVESIEKLKNHILIEYTSLDCIICNIGSGSSVIAGSENFEEWQRVFNINYFTTTNTIECFKDTIIKNETNLICISSICGIESISAPVTYSVAKSALINYVNYISKYFGQFGVRINAISPGNILFDSSVWQKKLITDKIKTEMYITNNVPLQKFGTPDDISHMALYLTSKYAKFITGTNIIIDGGQTKSI